MKRISLRKIVVKFAKYTGLTAAALIFAVFFAFVCLRFGFVEEAVKNYALSSVNAVLSAYKLEADAEKLDLNLPFSVRVRNVRLKDGQGEFLSLESLNVDSRFLALLRYRVVIPSIEFRALSLQRVPGIAVPEKPQEADPPLSFKEQFEQVHTLAFGKYMPSVLVSNISFVNVRISPAVLNSLKKSTAVAEKFFDEPLRLDGSWYAGLEKELFRFSGKLSAGYREKTASWQTGLDVSADKIIRLSAELTDGQGLFSSLAKNVLNLPDTQKAHAAFSFRAVGTIDSFEAESSAEVFDGDFLREPAAASMYYRTNPYAGSLNVSAKPLVPGLFNFADITAAVNLDTFSVSESGERLEDAPNITVKEALKAKTEIPNRNVGFSYSLQFKNMDFVNPALKELLGREQEITGQLDVQFFTRQLPKIMAKNINFIAKNVQYKTNIDISREIAANSEFKIKSFSFLDTPLQAVTGTMHGTFSASGRLEDPKLSFTAEIPQFKAMVYGSESDKKDGVNAQEFKLENLKFSIKSNGFEKPQEVIPLDIEALTALYRKHPYAASIKRMQELYQSAVNYPVKLLFSFKADYMDIHSAVESEIRMSPKVLGLGEGTQKFMELKTLKGTVFGAGLSGNLRVDMPLGAAEAEKFSDTDNAKESAGNEEMQALRISGALKGSMPNAEALENAFFIPLKLADLEYSLEFKHSKQKGQQVFGRARAKSGSYNLYEWQDFDLRLALGDLWGKGSADASVCLKFLELADIGKVTDLAVSLQGPFSKMRLRAGFGGDAVFETEAQLSTDLTHVSGEVQRFVFDYPYKKTKIALKKKAGFFISPEQIDLSQIILSIAPKGELTLSGVASQQKLDLRGNMKNIDLAYLPKDFKGLLNSHFTVSGTSSKPKGSMEILLKDFQTLSSPKASFSVKGNIAEVGQEHRANFSLTLLDKEKYGVQEAFVSLQIPLAYEPMLRVSQNRPVNGKIRYKGNLKTLWGYVPLDGRKLEGELDLSGTISGSLSRIALTLEAESQNARYEDLLLGVLFTEINLKTTLKNGRSRIEFFAKDGRKGTVSLNGAADIPFLYHGKYYPHYLEKDKTLSGAELERKIKQMQRSLAVVAVEAKVNGFNPFYRNDFTATLSGDLSIKGMVEALKIEGDITVDSGEVHLENIRSSSIPKLNIVEDSGKRIRRKKAANRGNLAIAVHILKNFGVYAPGIETMWKGELLLQGRLDNPAVKGTLSAWKGSMNILGTVLKLNKGDIVFNGGTPIVPDLDLKLEHTGNGVTSYITLKGMAFRPKLEMSSNPYLPSDEVLAHILFSRSMSELSDFEKIRLATVLTSLVGFDISSGITATTKNLFGLDVLSIDSRQSAGGEEEVSVQLGKYLRNNVYIGLEQEVSSPDTSGVLQYEVNENFSLGTKAGTEESEIGFKWKYDY